MRSSASPSRDSEMVLDRWLCARELCRHGIDECRPGDGKIAEAVERCLRPHGCRDGVLPYAPARQQRLSDRPCAGSARGAYPDAGTQSGSSVLHHFKRCICATSYFAHLDTVEEGARISMLKRSSRSGVAGICVRSWCASTIPVAWSPGTGIADCQRVNQAIADRYQISFTRDCPHLSHHSRPQPDGLCRGRRFHARPATSGGPLIMLIVKVVKPLVSTNRIPDFEHKYLQVVLDGSKKVAVDAVGAKPGDWVTCVSSSAAREAAAASRIPVTSPSGSLITGNPTHRRPPLLSIPQPQQTREASPADGIMQVMGPAGVLLPGCRPGSHAPAHSQEQQGQEAGGRDLRVPARATGCSPPAVQPRLPRSPFSPI